MPAGGKAETLKKENEPEQPSGSGVALVKESRKEEDKHELPNIVGTRPTSIDEKRDEEDRPEQPSISVASPSKSRPILKSRSSTGSSSGTQKTIYFKLDSNTTDIDVLQVEVVGPYILDTDSDDPSGRPSVALSTGAGLRQRTSRVAIDKENRPEQPSGSGVASVTESRTEEDKHMLLSIVVATSIDEEDRPEQPNTSLASPSKSVLKSRSSTGSSTGTQKTIYFKLDSDTMDVDVLQGEVEQKVVGPYILDTDSDDPRGCVELSTNAGLRQRTSRVAIDEENDPEQPGCSGVASVKESRKEEDKHKLLNIAGATSINEERDEEDRPEQPSTSTASPSNSILKSRSITGSNLDSDTTDDVDVLQEQVEEQVVLQNILDTDSDDPRGSAALSTSAGLSQHTLRMDIDNEDESEPDVVDDVLEDILEHTFAITDDTPVARFVHDVDTSEANGRIIRYFAMGSNLRTSSSLPFAPHTFKAKVSRMFKQVFLPHGFPESVSADYAEYQAWDTLQAFFSTLTGALTTHAIMKGVGVGDVQATAASAAITWILKDGTGMIGRIVFAWWKGTNFDSDCKKWRLFADILNDVAMFLECLLPYVSHSVYILCISTGMKSLVGVAGGATRAALTQHQAIRGNMADVSAKDGSQESCVNLIASLTGILLLMTIADGRYKWDMFFLFVLCHLMCNYRAVRAVQMATLNTARFVLIVRCYLVLKLVGSVRAINRNESVFIGRGFGVFKLCGYHIKLGASMWENRLSGRKIEKLRTFYNNFNYILYVDATDQTVQVFLKDSAESVDIIQAFYHAMLLAIGTCMKDNVHLFITSRELYSVENAPLDFMIDELVDPLYVGNRTELVMRTVRGMVENDFPVFYADLEQKGWDTTNLQFDVDNWRGQW